MWFGNPLTLEELVLRKPILYRKLCFWAGKRGLNQQEAALQVQAYLKELVLSRSDDRNPADLLRRWEDTLSPQERTALTPFSSIDFMDYPRHDRWYEMQAGEYSLVNEPLLGELCFDGQVQAILTNNRYDCLVLNTDKLLIVDVDIGPPTQSEWHDCSRNCQVVFNQRQALVALGGIVEQFPGLGFRVYQTRNGLRYFCTTQEFDPSDRNTYRLMQSLYADPLYARLCRYQSTFRARLSPKPWRMDVTDWEWAVDRTVGSWQDPETGLLLPKFSPYSVCRLLQVVGETTILPQFEAIIRVHDGHCRADQMRTILA
jgi:hypothetical protein